MFIEEKTDHNDLDRKYRIEPTLDSIYKECGKYFTTGITCNDSKITIDIENIKLSCEIINNLTEQKTTKSNFLKTFFHQSDNFKPTIKNNISIHHYEEEVQLGTPDD